MFREVVHHDGRLAAETGDGIADNSLQGRVGNRGSDGAVKAGNCDA
jgi:hypothetical protein